MSEIVNLNNFTLIMAWDNIKEKWFYFANKLDESILSEDYVKHEVIVVVGIITNDTFNSKTIGQPFKKFYSKITLQEVCFY